MNRRLRLLATISDLSRGGAEREFSILVNNLPPDRFDVRVALWRDIRGYAISDKLPVHILGKYRPWQVLPAMLRLKRLVDQWRPDVVFSMLQYVNLVTGEALRHSSWSPAWTCRFTNPPELEFRGLKRLWADRVFKRADRLLGCADGVSNALIEYFRLSPGQVETVTNPVDIGEIERLARFPLPFERDRSVFIVVHAGRFSEAKDQSPVA